MAGRRAPADDAANAAADWLTIWQSELAAMSQDRELAEAWLRWVSRTASLADRVAQVAHPAGVPDAPAESTGAAAAAGAASAMAAPDGRFRARDELAVRVAATEGPGEPRSDGAPDGGRAGPPGQRS